MSGEEIAVEDQIADSDSVTPQRRKPTPTRVASVALVLLAATAGGAAAKPPRAIEEFLRLPSMMLHLGLENRQFWILTPGALFVVDDQQVVRALRPGEAYTGLPVTWTSSRYGWLLGTTAGVWEIRLFDRDVRPLPDADPPVGIYRFDDDVALTTTGMFRLNRPWERYEFRDFSFTDVNSMWHESDTLHVATRVGLRRFLWERYAWDESFLGDEAATENVIRFLPRESHTQIVQPDTFVVSPPPLLIGARHIFYREPLGFIWRRVPGFESHPLRQANSDSAYLRIPEVMFQTHKLAAESDPHYRHWVLTPNALCRLDMATAQEPAVTHRFNLRGDARCARVDGPFVWVGTTEGLSVLDRQLLTVYEFAEDIPGAVYGFYDWPEYRTYVLEGWRRGWFALTDGGLMEIFTDTWTWNIYPLPDFGIADVRGVVPDRDGFWIGTRRGLRWYSTQRREWDASAVPSALVDDPILRLEWHRKHLYVLAEDGLYTSSLYSDAWRRLD